MSWQALLSADRRRSLGGLAEPCERHGATGRVAAGGCRAAHRYRCDAELRVERRDEADCHPSFAGVDGHRRTDGEGLGVERRPWRVRRVAVAGYVGDAAGVEPVDELL